MRVAIFGGLKWANEIENILDKGTEIAFFLDNNDKNWGISFAGIEVVSPYSMPEQNFDYVIIMLFRYDQVIKQLEYCGVEKKKVVLFFDLSTCLTDFDVFTESAVVFRLEKIIEDMQIQSQKRERLQECINQHLQYEVADKLKKKQLKLPDVCTVEETCEKIITEHVSMSRYGDGEFEIIFGHAKDVYQGDNQELAVRLQEILASQCENHIVAIADDYGAMEGLSEYNKNVIRCYMTDEKRMQHYDILNMDRKYYNAYISRPYVIYPHEKRNEAKLRFDNLKKIWEGQRVVLVEGNLTRMGIGNDLFDNAKSVERVLAPNCNAYNVYDELLQTLLTEDKNQLFLIALGPTATVLAYDLAQNGYWALDVGHLDLEYEWFLNGDGYSYIPGKYNNEVMGDTEVAPMEDEKYLKSIKYSVGI